MAVCTLNKNLDRTGVCGYSLPQIIDLYIANYADVKGTTVGSPEEGTGVEVKTITMNSDAKWYHIEPNKNSASWSDNLQVGGSGNKYKLHSISFSYSSDYNAEMVDVIDSLALGRYIVVAKMAGENEYVMFGRGVGMEASESDSVSNTGSGDATAEAGLTVTLTANIKESALPLSEGAISTVLNEVVGA